MQGYEWQQSNYHLCYFFPVAEDGPSNLGVVPIMAAFWYADIHARVWNLPRPPMFAHAHWIENTPWMDRGLFQLTHRPQWAWPNYAWMWPGQRIKHETFCHWHTASEAWRYNMAATKKQAKKFTEHTGPSALNPIHDTVLVWTKEQSIFDERLQKWIADASKKESEYLPFTMWTLLHKLIHWVLDDRQRKYRLVHVNLFIYEGFLVYILVVHIVEWYRQIKSEIM